MTEPIRFDGISLPVSDVDRSVAFYQQFGYELQIRHDDFALLRLGEGTIGLLKMDLSRWPSAPRGAIHFELSTENLDMLFEQLQAQGASGRIALSQNGDQAIIYWEVMERLGMISP